MESQASSWIDRKVDEILDELLPDGDPPGDLVTAWTLIRFAYGSGYVEGLAERPDL